MRVISLPEGENLSWYLDQEEQIARAMQSGDEPVFFTWIAGPTVICGRHQVIENEVNISYCREHDIAIVQRKSGGGCVYADRGNLMLSYISPSAHSESVFSEFMLKIAQSLLAVGFPAVTTEHNDILISGSKVSGSACFHLSNATIVHSTMLYDVNFSVLQQAITPSAQKLAKHSIASVRQRVVNLSSVPNNPFPTIQSLREYISHYVSQLELI